MRFVMTPEQVEAHNRKVRGARKVSLMDDAGTKYAKKPKAEPKPRKKWDYEERLAQQLEEAGINGFFVDEEYINDRKLRGDIVFPLRKLIVEIQGEAHRVKQRFYDDIEKAQATLLAGYTLIPISTRQVKDGSAVGVIRSVMDIQLPRCGKGD